MTTRTLIVHSNELKTAEKVALMIKVHLDWCRESVQPQDSITEAGSNRNFLDYTLCLRRLFFCH